MAPGAGVMTGDEQRAVINQRIDGSLEAFDRRIRDAQDALNKERDRATGTGGSGLPGAEGSATVASAGGGGGAKGGGSGAATARSGGGASGGRSGSATGGAVSHGSAGGRSSGSANAGGSGPVKVPADVADGSDDDIVARQLREAAMKEKDPVLRDKLWQEYRDYKKGAT